MPRGAARKTFLIGQAGITLRRKDHREARQLESELPLISLSSCEELVPARDVKGFPCARNTGPGHCQPCRRPAHTGAAVSKSALTHVYKVVYGYVATKDFLENACPRLLSTIDEEKRIKRY